jgi:hypothetical protein
VAFDPTQRPVISRYLEENDVAAEWIARLADGRSADGRSADVVWLTWPERRSLSGHAATVADLLASCPAPLTADEAFESVTAASLQVRDRLMDRAEAHRRCRIARLAAQRAPVLEALLNGRRVP